MSAAVDVAAGIDQNEIRRTLAQYEGVRGRVSVMYLQEQGAVPTYASYATTAAELEQAVRDIVKADLADEPLGIYLRGTTVADGVSGRGGSDDTVTWLSFRADLDLGKPGGPATWDDLFATFEGARLPTPTYWQHSGGGFYPTWLLAEPVAHSPEVETLAADIEAELRRAWQAAGYTSGVDSCHDAARVWRLAGSVHRKNRDMPITSTVGKFSGEVLTVEQLRERTPTRERPAGWDGRRSAPRRATAEAFEQTYQASLAACRERGRDHFRHTFFVAARNAHRMTAIGLRTPDEARAELLDLVQTFWPGMGFNGDDRRHIHDALNNGLDRGDNAGALASPWELITPPVGADTSADEFFGSVPRTTGEIERAPTSEEVAQYTYERDKAEEKRRLRLRREAAAELAAEERDPLTVLDAAAFLDAPQPDYLVPRLLYRDSTAKVFGPPGGTKSFFLLDLALSLATGTDWHDMSLPRTRVHFVMAEGQAVNVARALAWLHARGVDRTELDGWFTAIPQGVLLTPEGIQGYREIVAEQQPGLIVLDTKNAMMLGEENSASDVAVMVRAMRELRDAAGGACVALVDHTGLQDTSRGRGSNAVTAAMDTEVRVERDEGGTATAQVTRDKAAEPGATWTYRLERVEHVPGLRPGAPPPAVVMPAEKMLSVSIHAQDEWWKVPTEKLPAAVQQLGGASGEAARDLFRVLLYAAGDDGLTMPEATRMLRERCPRTHGSDNLGNARKRLMDGDLIEHGQTASGGIAERRYRVSQHVLRALQGAAGMSD